MMRLRGRDLIWVVVFGVLMVLAPFSLQAGEHDEVRRAKNDTLYFRYYADTSLMTDTLALGDYMKHVDTSVLFTKYITASLAPAKELRAAPICSVQVEVRTSLRLLEERPQLRVDTVWRVLEFTNRADPNKWDQLLERINGWFDDDNNGERKYYDPHHVLWLRDDLFVTVRTYVNEGEWLDCDK